MKKSFRTVAGCSAIALITAAMFSLASAEEPSDSPSPEALLKAAAEAGKPGPEHLKLQPLEGEWTYTNKMWIDPSQPPIESSGTIVRRWILGKRFLEERVIGKGPDGKTDFEGRGIIGFDKTQDKYTYTWMCTMGTGCTSSLGTCDKAGEHFTFATEMFCPIRNCKVKGRDEILIKSADKHVLEMYQFEDGKELKMMELTAVREK